MSVSMKNREIFIPGFVIAFRNLMKVDKLKGSTKLNLVKARKELEDQSADIIEAKQKLDETQVEELLDCDHPYHFTTIDIDEVTEHLCPDDIFNLQPLFTKE